MAKATTLKKLCISDYDAYGFDVDHTLAKYNIPELFDLVNKSMSEFLVTEKGYGVSLLEPFDTDFCCRGIMYDMPTGNFLKLSENGTVFRAFHGTKLMTDEEIVDQYGKSRHWPHFEEMIETVNNIGEEFRIFENFFDMPLLLPCARIIDQLDEKNGGEKLEKYDFWKDVFAAAQYTYNHLNFAKDAGGFFPVWKENTSRYVAECNVSVKAWLKKLKQGGKKVFIVTSSFNNYAVASLKHILGDDWKDYFDIVLTFARKPGFFKQKRAFLHVENLAEKEPVKELNETDIFSQGNHETLIHHLQQTTGKSNPKVLFFGDSLRSDVHPAKKYANWDTVLVLEEMLAEQHCFEAEADMEPSGKRKRVEEPSELEKKYLTSKKWGSFFTDTLPKDTETAKASAKQENLENNENDDKNINYMNTLWAYIVRKYADIAIPQLEYISDLCLDHEFEVFDHEVALKWGFYPGLPKALQKS